VPLAIKPTEKGRVFNLVPGIEAIPIMAKFGIEKKNVTVTIKVL
jgi:hypothetical protein